MKIKEAAFYFPHDVRARSDLKIRAVVSEFGIAGYGAFWVVVEVLRESDGYGIPNEPWARKALSAELPGIDVDSFLSLLIESGLLVEEDGKLYSPSLIRRMEKLDDIRSKRAEAGRSGGRKKKESETSVEPEEVKPEGPAAGVLQKMSQNEADDERLRLLVDTIADDMVSRYPVQTGNRPEIEKAIAKAVKFQKLSLEVYNAGMSSFLREYAPFVSREYLPLPTTWIEKNRWLDNWKDLGFTARTKGGAKNGNGQQTGAPRASNLRDQLTQ